MVAVRSSYRGGGAIQPTRRVVTALLEGAAGPLQGEPTAPLAGYVAFATLAMYMIGLVLLPAARPSVTTIAVVATASGDLVDAS